MLLTIYDKQGNKVAEISPDTSSTQQKEVEGDNVLTLSFKHYQKMELDVNAYTDFMGERYWLTERYQPKQLSEQSWQYDLKLYGVESLVKRFLVLETTDGNAIPQGTTYIIKAYSSDGTLQAMRNLCSVSRLHKPITVKQVNGTDLYADTASIWQQAIVQHNGEAIEQAERCVRLDLYADTYNETAHWLGEGAYVHFPLDGLNRGNTTDTDYLSTYYDYDYKGEHHVATDASGVAYADKSGEPYIFT